MVSDALAHARVTAGRLWRIQLVPLSFLPETQKHVQGYLTHRASGRPWSSMKTMDARRGMQLCPGNG